MNPSKAHDQKIYIHSREPDHRRIRRPSRIFLRRFLSSCHIAFYVRARGQLSRSVQSFCVSCGSLITAVLQLVKSHLHRVRDPHVAVVANDMYGKVECEIETQQVIHEDRLKAGAVQGGGMLKERSQKNELEESQERAYVK
ncbi:Uncharacterized protein HZ326_30104 [Fusarium oxysporum f. sp. albedinis]|nr:Uncharacterized protein HZ326_30104 [Fusarium oxysporum f. sp. albedinis]